MEIFSAAERAHHLGRGEAARGDGVPERGDGAALCAVARAVLRAADQLHPHVQVALGAPDRRGWHAARADDLDMVRKTIVSKW